jgi:hypothetical protein
MKNQDQVIQKDLLDKCYKKIGVYEIIVESQKEFMGKQEKIINEIKEANHGMNCELIKRGRAIEILGEELDNYENMFNSYHIQFSN